MALAQPTLATAPGDLAQPGRRAPVRLLTLTTLFPNARHPRHGIFIANRLSRMRDTGRIEATVVAAVPWFPGAYRAFAEIPRDERVAGFRVRHPRYLQIPAAGMRLQPHSLARALLADLRDAGLSGRDFDVIDAHYFYPDGVAAARVARMLGLPLVINARGSDINLIGDIAFARKRMLQAAREARALIAVSGALATRMQRLGMPADRIHVLRNGVDAALFAPAPRLQSRRRLGLEAGAQWILGVGNLVPEKGFDLLIRATARLPRARLLIIGRGPLRRRLATIADEVAPGRVVFRDDMPQTELRFAYAASDVLGLPSLREGWPNVVLEAIACGTPVVASPVGGIPEILRDDAPACLVREREPDAWATALHAMTQRWIDAQAVRCYALAFEWDEIVARQCDLYERIAPERLRSRD